MGYKAMWSVQNTLNFIWGDMAAYCVKALAYYHLKLQSLLHQVIALCLGNSCPKREHTFNTVMTHDGIFIST
jgi:hypothetical protein